MTQKKLIKTLYLPLLITLGVIWPWSSANSQQNCDALSVEATFEYFSPSVGRYTIKCMTQFSCPPNSFCQSNNTVKLSDPLRCWRTSNPDTICSDAAPGGEAQYDPTQTVLKSDVTFQRPTCGCDTIKFVANSNVVTATRCTGGGIFPGSPSRPLNTFNGQYNMMVPTTGCGQ